MFLNRILYAPDSDTGGGTGDGSGKNKADNSLTRETVQEMVNGAIADATKRTLKKVDELIKKSITDVTAEDSPLMQQFAELKKSLGGKAKESAKKDTSTATDIPDNVQEQLNAQTKQIEKLQSQLQKAENEKKAREEQDRNNKRRAHLNEFLDKQGFKSRAKAVAALHWSDIKWEDDGSELGKPVIRNSKGEEVPYQDFVTQEFVKSDEGKDLLAVDIAKTGSGAGEHDIGVPGLNLQPGNVPDPSKMSDEELEKSFAALVK
jgi:hypothetical protein